MTKDEKKTMKMLAHAIYLEIDRMCDTHDLSEFVSVCRYVKSNLDTLLKMICEVRFVAESEE